MSAADKDDLPTVEIKVSKVGSGQVVMHERYQVDPELAKTLIDDLTDVIAQLPQSDRRRVSKQERHLKRPDGKSFTRIDLTVQAPQPIAQPSFEQQFKLSGDVLPGGVSSPKGEASAGGDASSGGERLPKGGSI